MTQEGTVVLAEAGFVLVQIERKSACDGCHQKDGCRECASVITVKAENCCNAKQGDLVEVFTATPRVVFYGAAVFILPLIFAFCGYFLGELLFEHQLFSALTAFFSLVLSFVILRLTLNRRAEKECTHRAVRIVNRCLEDQ